MEIMDIVAQLMELAARTAPKAGGKDFIEMKVITGAADLTRLADAMVAYGPQTGKKNFDRDGENIRRSGAVLLVGLKKADTIGLNCGACGHPRCADLPDRQEGPEFQGPWCAYRVMDLGIALGSAAKTASILNVDSRIMYRVGALARKLDMIDAQLVLGIPVSATGKSIYFDR